MAKQGYASIGTDISVNSVSMNYVTDFSDLGGAPNMLETTCLKDKMQHHAAGVQQMDAWEVTFLFDNSAADSDYRVLKALADSGEEVPVSVTYPDGTKFTSKGTVSVYPTGAQVDALLEAKLSVALSEDWTVTNPTTT